MNINKKYNCIVIDPPWSQSKTGSRKVRPNQKKTLEYPTMNKEELKNMPIIDIFCHYFEQLCIAC